ncbi:hypothetical protein BGW36DRAFT_400541 [Talaromyces proteolyticus]|uniref:Core domain-containing protein n=1 Tax=Talaromyces proteolyticus TaxID=1131652 RepID=A0AAD4KFL4_9EURO|nr:uncharacterized protein BGW36DRAFT_400541 [Talaromyces proteolyticus]KAH8691198.1 hypothetical protein BGW36DRAFT_400541 [Talaromyces proteolyticus]
MSRPLHIQPCRNRHNFAISFSNLIVPHSQAASYSPNPVLCISSRQSVLAKRSQVSPPHRSSFNKQLLSFTTTAQRRATSVVLNPKEDDDGNPLLIEISPRAAKRLRDITDPASTSVATTLKGNPYNHLRITVTSGGCHGFQYLMSLESSSKIDAEEDTIFEAEAEPADSSETKGEAKVVMDGPSLELLSGSTVDFTTELIGSQFKIVDNPRATSNCGCGTSFDVKD